jgi:hypothetical protein
VELTKHAPAHHKGGASTETSRPTSTSTYDIHKSRHTFWPTFLVCNSAIILLLRSEMGYSVEWNLIRSPGIVLVGKQFDANESMKEVQKVALIDLVLSYFPFSFYNILTSDSRT